MIEEVFSPNPEAPALVIGAAGFDVIGKLKGDLLKFTSNPAQVRFSFGGVARNVSENLARLGQQVILISAVGEDELGERLLIDLNDLGVDVEHVLYNPNRPTGAYLGIIGEDGNMQFALDDMRALTAVSAVYLRERKALFENASVVYIDANLPKETIRTAISLANHARVPVCADPASVGLAGRLRPYLNRLALITPNLNEAAVLCERSLELDEAEDVIDAAKCLVSSGVGIVIVTRAQFGVSYATSETSGHISAIRTQILDPTGAGDALSSTVVFALLNGIPLDEAIRLGVSAATLTLRYPGSVMPDLTLQKLYDELVI
jgi:pseudouridine kinase